MSTPLEWTAYTLTAVSVSTVVAAIVYACVGNPNEDHYCAVCDKVTPWHPKNGCTVCRTLDSVF
jgi:hypothetical protein